MTKQYKLIIFDLDGTLAPQDSETIWPDSAKWLNDHPDQTVMVATNQGGVGLRHWMESAKFGEPDKYPTMMDVQYRFAMLFSAVTRPVGVLMCARYKSKKSGQWCPVPEEQAHMHEWRENWRKPAPGMLLYAMEMHRATPAETLMVGDDAVDQQAAEAAGCDFQWAWQFFGRKAPIDPVWTGEGENVTSA